jgi:hypothetical protein
MSAVAERFDRYSVDQSDEMLAVGGRVSPVRFDPTGFEDCAREWDPCECHGDRLCRLGQLIRFERSSAEHAAWLRGERETPVGPELMRMSGFSQSWELALALKADQRNVRDLWREAWPLIAVCAAEERSRQSRRSMNGVAHAHVWADGSPFTGEPIEWASHECVVCEWGTDAYVPKARPETSLELYDRVIGIGMALRGDHEEDDQP